MTTITEASRQWSTRPDEERFLSLPDMLAAAEYSRQHSRQAIVSSRRLQAIPTDDNRGILIEGPNGHGYAPSHHAFGQLATLVQAPAGYRRQLPAPMAADCINYGLQVSRDVEEVGVLITRPEHASTGSLRAATGPRYGRVWNSDVIRALADKFGDGVTGNFRVPGEFGRAVEVTKQNTTLYASDRDMFVFLADEENRIELPNRRDGKTGALARGFFVTNSEVGAGALKVKTFLFDYVCMNRIVWGAEHVQEIAIRHTAGAPDRFLEQVQPALIEYANSSAHGITAALQAAQSARLDDKVTEFLAKRFGPRVAVKMQHAHMLDEGRPVETVWDAVTAATAYARDIPYTADRGELETQAGAMLELVR
jgi:hypothetical protein